MSSFFQADLNYIWGDPNDFVLGIVAPSKVPIRKFQLPLSFMHRTGFFLKDEKNIGENRYSLDLL